MFRPSFGSRLPVARPHLVPPPRRQRVLAHRSLVCSFLLTLLLLLSQVLGNWGFLVKPAEAASLGVRPSAPASMTMQQYLKEGQQSKAYHGPLIPPARKQTTGQSTNYAHLPPSAEPAR